MLLFSDSLHAFFMCSLNLFLETSSPQSKHEPKKRNIGGVCFLSLCSAREVVLANFFLSSHGHFGCLAYRVDRYFAVTL